jgi:5-deoxy-glucuronate isomerase
MIRLDGDVRRLLEAGTEGRIGAARTHGPVNGRTDTACAWLLVERGTGSMTAGDVRADVAGRDDVFAAPGWSAFVGPHTEFALDGDIDATIVWRASDRTPKGTATIIEPQTVPDEARGEGTTARRVRTYIAAGELVVGETLNPPGGWSSWPPHQHTHEEIYLYRFDPRHGFGVHASLAADGPSSSPSWNRSMALVVRDGDIVRITDGEHPVVAAPGCTMYYLWALAGDTDVPDTRTNPLFT